MTTHIGVLLTNNDPSAFAKAYPDDGQKVVALLQPLRPEWHFTVYDLPNGHFPDAGEAGLDGVVITGSPASVNDTTLGWVAPLFELIRRLDARRLPTIGICFGHQAIAAALGGQVERHAGGWGLGLGLTHWHALRPWMQPPVDDMWLMAAHNEQVVRLPPGAMCLGGSDFCPIGAMAIDDHIFTTQFHPEMTRPFMADLLHFLQDRLDVPTLARARESLSQYTESSQLFAHWMARFLDRRQD